MPHDEHGLAPKPISNVQQVLEINTDPAAAAQQGVDIAATVHSLLRGRYLWAISLALIGLLAGAVIGYRAVPLKYRSSGIIRIRASVAPVLYQNERNGEVPNFAGFIESQLTLLLDQRLIEAAIQEPDWQKLDRGDSPEEVADYLGHLEVERPENSELIVVSFVDQDPAAAMTGVRSLIKAYEHLYVQGDIDSFNQRMKVLEGLENRYNSELQKLNEQISAIASEFGSDSLAPVYDFRLKQLQKLESDLLELQLQVTALGGEAGANPATSQPAAPPSPEQVAIADPQMRQLLNDRALIRRDLDILLARLGPRHPDVRTKEDALSRIDNDIDQLCLAYTSQNPSTLAVRPLGQLRAREDAVRSMIEAAKHDTYDVGRKNIQIAGLRERAEAIRARLQETRQRIESLNVESSISNRVSVVSYGDHPLAPYKDRRKAAAAGAGLGGAALGFGSILLLGLLDRRVRGVADAQHVLGSDIRLLGTLPDLSGSEQDHSVRLQAAHEVHCIRAMLQDPAAGGGHVVAITSPGSGDGKTSLSLALGHSFAKTGARTLVVDFDLIGRNLSSRMNQAVRLPIGRILRQLGLVTRDQVRDALRTAMESGQRVGQVLVDRGAVHHADVMRALEIQNRDPAGLTDAMAGQPIDNCVVASDIENLFLLPMGQARAQNIEELSPKVVQRIIQSARDAFDTVIFDTGPILGSLEARLIAAQADQVVLTVAHGSQRPAVFQALSQLKACGAKLAGVVFNRARPIDLVTSASNVSLRSRPGNGTKGDASEEDGGGLSTAVVSPFHHRRTASTQNPE